MATMLTVSFLSFLVHVRRRLSVFIFVRICHDCADLERGQGV